MEIFKRLRRRRWRLVAVGALGAVVVGSGAALFMNEWICRYAEPYVFAAVADAPPRQVAIVLGAKVWPDGTPSHALEDRLQTALELYRAGKVRRVLVSGDHGAPEYDEVNAMARWLADRGVPDEDVFLDHAGFRTLDTMERARQVFLVDGAVVCTQEYHLPRSIFLARRAGIDAVGVVADKREYVHARSNRMREFVARTLAFLDSYVLGTGPRHLGDAVSIAGDGRQTRD